MRRIFFILLPVSLLAFIALSVLFPNVAKETVQKKRELAQLKHEETLMPQLSATVSSKEDEIALITSAFPKKKDFIAVVQALDSKAARSGVTIELHFESEDVIKDANGDDVVPIKLIVEGEFTHITQFMNELKQGNYLFAIQSVEGDASSGIKGKNKVTIGANFYASTE